MVDIWNKTKQNVNGIKLLVEIQVILDSVYEGSGAGGEVVGEGGFIYPQLE